LRIMREPKFYVSGFDHPKLLVFTNVKPYDPQEYQWGLIPYWVKNSQTATTLMNQTLNAKGESIFTKPAFKNSAFNKRCIVYLDAFYEHHHAHKQTFPYRISMKDDSPLPVAGLWDEWENRESGEIFKTVTLVTTKANPLLAKIHNNPKLEEARMPVILPKYKQDEWLVDCKTEEDQSYVQGLITPYNDDELTAYTVRRLKGKNAAGNVPEVEKEVVYPELSFGSGRLFDEDE
jgi:putative SOS response-associated peptidase YedK